MDKQQILQIASQSPDFPQAVQALKQEIASNPITPEGLAELIQMFEMALNNPEQYPAILEAAIQDDYIEPGDLPEQFDPVILISTLAALYIVQAEMGSGAGMGPETGMPQPPAFARGGLAQAAQRLAAQGRGGDTMLAHINPREAAMLRRVGGGGSINPVTGLPEYFSLKKFIGAVLPIALNFIVPGAGAALGAALGATGAGASILGGALIGGASSALSGGKFGQGALLGGLGGGLGSVVGGAANSAMGLGLGEAGQSILGSGLVGGVAGAATGQGFGKGALQGAGGAYLGQAVGGVGGEGFKSAGQTFGNMMTAGYDPKTSALAGGLSGLATAMNRPAPAARSGLGFKSPSDIVVGELQAPSSTYGGVPEAGLRTNYMTGDVGYQGPADFAVDYSLQNPGAPAAPAGFGGQDLGSGVMPNAAPSTNLGAAAPKGAGLFGTNVSAGQALALASMAGSLSGAPQPVQQAVKTLSPAQQEYFNRPSVTFDWNRMQQDASRSGLSLNQYMAQAWPQITGGAYNQSVQRPGYARGGALSQVARMARGSGSGRADTIDAKLSDGEYVMDAETVAMLGDGSTKEGARRLDKMRTSLRAHKGKALAKGKFSPDAKSPLSYLKEAA